MSDPERYVTTDALQDELPFDEAAFPTIDDWAGLLERLLDEESERIEGSDYADRTFDEDVPGPVKDGVIRLVRSRLDRIKTDGLETESLSDGSSYGYRPPEAVRADVRSAVAKYREDGEDEATGAFVI